MNEQSPQGIDEKREKPKLEVWVIEDDNTSRKLIVAVVGMKMPESRCVGFEKAEDALGEFEEKKLEGKPLPAGIFVDGSLLQDSESFQ